MDPEARRLKVNRAPQAIDDLDHIWRWNASRYTVVHADKYLSYLKDNIDALATNHAKGRPVPARPELRYLMIRRKSRGHGHVVVYSADASAVNVVHVFHSAQDWPTKLAQNKI